ncbi:MAG: hypothetical protein ACP5UH_03345 [Candidatus Micrarchaeia archaeon]
MPALKGIKFVTGKPALIVEAAGDEYLVVGDLHIGIELELSAKGIHLFNVTDALSNNIISIMDDFSLNNIILLGDIKNSIMRPTRAEALLIKGFFESMKDYSVFAIAGNHDTHMGELTGMRMHKELVIGNYAFMHGHARPSQRAMQCDFIITAHNHAIARTVQKDGSIRDEKVWIVADISKKAAKKEYESFNPSEKLIVEPAFNDMIMGRPVASWAYDRMSVLFKSGLFGLKGAKIYTLYGSRIAMSKLARYS